MRARVVQGASNTHVETTVMGSLSSPVPVKRNLRGPAPPRAGLLHFHAALTAPSPAPEPYQFPWRLVPLLVVSKSPRRLDPKVMGSRHYKSYGPALY